MSLPQVTRSSDAARFRAFRECFLIAHRDDLVAHWHGIERLWFDFLIERKLNRAESQVEKQRLVVGICLIATSPIVGKCAISIGNEVRYHARRQLRTWHVVPQVETRVRTLVISLRRAVQAIVWVFHQTVNIVHRSCVIGREARDTYAYASFHVAQNQFLAPVTDDVAPESSTLGINREITIAAQLGDFYFSSLKEVLDIHIVVTV